VVFVLVSGGGDSSEPAATTEATTLPATGEAGTAGGAGKQGQSGGQSADDGQSGAGGNGSSGESGGGRGRAVPAPAFSAPVAEQGQLPGRLDDVRRDLDSGTLTLSDLEGTPTVLTGVASWCEFCGPEARLLESEWTRWGRRGVLYLGLDTLEPENRAQRFADQFGLTFPVLSDADGKIARSFRMHGVPETIFISAKGDILGRVVGGASIGQLELGSSATQSGDVVGVERGGAQMPLR
jgi:cytochrome c biogenesis protein CcmG/thiol:disulfide interchange protein DsbE